MPASFYRARIYNEALGRFMQTDPIGYKDDANLYAYVGDDPVNHVDPTGESCTKVDQHSVECHADRMDGQPINRDALTQKQKNALDAFNKSYTAAVNNLLSHPNFTASADFKDLDKIETVTGRAGDVAQALIVRNVDVHPTLFRKDTVASTALGNTWVLSPGYQGYDARNGGTVPSAQQRDVYRQETMVHEGMHGNEPPLKIDWRAGNFGNLWGDRQKAWDMTHGAAYDQVARRLIEGK